MSSRKRQGRSRNFSRSSAAIKYYSYGAQATKIEDAKDDVSLKYYGRAVKKQERTATFGRVRKIICAFIICCCAMTIVFAKSLAYNYKHDNSILKGQLEEQRSKTEKILAQSVDSIDMEYVEQAATTRLGMAKPQPYQIQDIMVPKTDYTVIHGPSIVAEKEKPSVIAVFKQVFTK